MTLKALKILSQIFRIDQERCERIFKSVWNWLPINHRQKEIFLAQRLDSLEKFLAINELSIKRFPQTKSHLLQFLQGQRKVLRYISHIIDSGDVLLESPQPSFYMNRLMEFLLWSLSPTSRSIVHKLKLSSPTQFISLKKSTLLYKARAGTLQIEEIHRIQENIRLIVKELSENSSATTDLQSESVQSVAIEPHGNFECSKGIVPVNENELSYYNNNQVHKRSELQEINKINPHILKIIDQTTVATNLEQDVGLLRKALLLGNVDKARVFELALNTMDTESKQHALAFGLDSLEKLLAINVGSVKRLRPRSLAEPVTKCRSHALELLSQDHMTPNLDVNEIWSELDEKRLMIFINWSLSQRSYNVLKDSYLSVLSQFMGLEMTSLFRMRNLGKSSITEILSLKILVRYLLGEIPNPESAWETSQDSAGDHQIGKCPCTLADPNDEHSLFQSFRDGLSAGSRNVLNDRKILTIQDVIALKPTVISRWRRIDTKTIREIMGMRSDVIELIKAGYPTIDRQKVRADNPLVPNESLDLLGSFTLADPKDEHSLVQSFKNDLSVRSRNVLNERNIVTIREVMALSPRIMGRWQRLGRKSISEIMGMRSRFVELIKARYPTLNSEKDRADNPLVPNESLDLLGSFTLADPKDEHSLFQLFKNGLSVRSRNVLNERNIATIRDVMALDPEAMKRWQRLGRKSISDIMRMRSHVVELIKAGYPTIDLEKVSVDNPIVSNEKFDLLNPFESLMRWLERVVHGMKDPQQAKWVFASRKGLLGVPRLTLEGIAVKLGCTRERSRQKLVKIEERALRNSSRQELKPLINEIERLVKTSGGALGLDNITGKLLVRGQSGEMLLHALPFLKWLSTFPEWNELGLRVDPSGIVLTRDFDSLVDQLVDRIPQFSLEEADEFVDKDQWSVKVRALLVRIDQWYLQNPYYRKDLVKISIEMLDKILERLPSRLKRHGDKIYSFDLWLKRFAETDLASAAAYFLEQSKEAMHFSDVTVYLKNNPNYANKWCLSETSVYSALEKSPQLLLWNRGTFIHRNCVHIPHVLLNKIETWVLSKLRDARDAVPFISAFGPYTEFKKDCLAEGMPSEIALYSLLRDLGHPLLDYPRLPYISLNSINNGPVSIKKALDNFLLEARGPVKFEEIKSFALNRLFIKGYQLNSTLVELKNILRVDRKTFLHLNYLSINLDRFKEISMHVQTILNQKDHVAVGKIFSQKKVTCKMAGIKSPVELYSLLKMYDHEEFDLSRYPMIRKKFKDGTTEVSATLRHAIAAYMLERSQPVSFSEVKDVFVKDQGYESKYVETCIYTSSEIVKCLTGCFIHKDVLGWNEEKQHHLEALAHSCYSESTAAGLVHGSITNLLELSLSLPPLDNGCLWTKFLASEMLTSRNRFIVLGNAYEAYMPMPNEHGIMNFTDMVCFVLDRDFGGSANLEEFTEQLRKGGLVTKTFSKNMVDYSNKLVFAGKEIWLDEGLEYA